MRSARQLPDGTIDVSTKIQRSYADLERYMRNQSGESILEIARKDQLDPETVKISIRKGANMYEAQQLLELKRLKYEVMISNEKGRRDLQLLIPKMEKAIDLLLSGERTIPEINQITGEITFKTYVDMEMVIAGIGQLRKAISMEEKPAASQTTVNIQQNNVAGDAAGGVGGVTYEERIERIRAAQERTLNPVIDVQATTVDAEEPAVEAEADERPKEDGWEF